MSNLPDIPESGGGLPIPDFLSAENVGDGIVPPPGPIPKGFDFSIKQSKIFGLDSGEKFDEGALWYPLREVHFALTDGAVLEHYQGHYDGRCTSVFKESPPDDPIQVKLQDDEYIVGYRGEHTLTLDAIPSISRIYSAYSENSSLVGVRIWTTNQVKDIGKVDGPIQLGKDSDAFFVPENHEVVSFFGFTNGDGLIHGLGVSYIRRLPSYQELGFEPTDGSLLADEVGAASQPGPGIPSPKLSTFLSEAFLDAFTQESWANNDMAAIVKKRDQASQELTPLLEKIEKQGSKAWKLVQSGKQEFYVAKDGPNLVWSYVTQKPGPSGTSEATISVGQYCKATNSIGVSGYRWSNIPEKYESEIKKIALAFVYMIKPLITDGIEWGLKYAQSQLVQYLSQALATGLALILPASLAASGGLAIAGVIGSLVAYGVLKLFKKLTKKYKLVLNVYNFDIEHEWSSITHYPDNSQVINGEWQSKTIPKFRPIDKSVLPPGLDPDKPFVSCVTYLSMTFDNKQVLKGGVGEAVLLCRDDKLAGLALGYVVRAWKDNELGLEPINRDPTKFDLKQWYNKKGNVIKRLSQEVKLGKLTIAGSTPKLGGADNGGYFFDVSIGLPPVVTI
ncbi:putative transmembrane protein [Rhizoctonia solani 123E]|uniref:Putative transmembrane protein n=1 Tax=Rhizoctonia solani 123E TaxID=1423351 RepID=A0A074RFS5_9AGAM|nr:putative transmembrane protein [Rhizoctonia solani 123E]